MPTYAFGTGELWGVNTGVTPNVPVKFGALQNVSVDFNFTAKELYSSYQFPINVARGTAKVSFKAAFAQINGAILNQLFFGQAATTGTKPMIVSGEAAVGAATVTVANGATYSQDLGVRYAATGLYLTPVTSGAVAGQYTVNTVTGAYTFTGTDVGKALLFDYSYNPSLTTGLSIPLSNQLLGAAATFAILFRMNYQGAPVTLKLNACISTQLSFATKLEDFMMPDFSGSAFCDASNNLGTFGTAE